jgi:hypothetical protein
VRVGKCSSITKGLRLPVALSTTLAHPVPQAVISRKVKGRGPRSVAYRLHNECELLGVHVVGEAHTGEAGLQLPDTGTRSRQEFKRNSGQETEASSSEVRLKMLPLQSGSLVLVHGDWYPRDKQTASHLGLYLSNDTTYALPYNAFIAIQQQDFEGLGLIAGYPQQLSTIGARTQAAPTRLHKFHTFEVHCNHGKEQYNHRTSNVHRPDMDPTTQWKHTQPGSLPFPA